MIAVLSASVPPEVKNTSAGFAPRLSATIARDASINSSARAAGEADFAFVKEIAAGFECGINLGDFSDLQENDEIECYVLEEVK